MKKHLINRAVLQSLLSIATLGIFIILAIGSVSKDVDKINIKTEYLGEGVFKEKEIIDDEGRELTTEGKTNKYGRFQGQVLITKDYLKGATYSTEKVHMEDGKRHGKSRITFTNLEGTHDVDPKCYNMDIPVDCEEETRKSDADVSTFQVLSNKYPWFLNTLETFGFDKLYVKAYMDTLETVLATYEFNETMFDNYFQEVMDSLGNTDYDSLMMLNINLSFYQGLRELKRDELRMAEIDRYRSDGNTTYNVLKTTYPGYVQNITDAGVSEQDMERFCEVLDSLMTDNEAIYGTLDQEDPYFLDSVDIRFFRAFSSIMDTEESNSSALKSLKSLALIHNGKKVGSGWGIANSLISKLLLESDPAIVGDYILLNMYFRFDEGDIIKQSVRKAYLTNNGVVRLPTLTTEFSNHNSASSATLKGYVHEDGGADVTSRGIAWADFYNPTTSDQSETYGTGLGTFEASLINLIEGNTYYARSFATNSAGTAYGNCVTFIAGASVGIIENELMIQDLNVYPNPASTSTTFSFKVESSENLELSIINLKGQAVYRNDLGSLSHGDNQIELDLSSLQNGLYSCHLMENGIIKGMCKLVISR